MDEIVNYIGKTVSCTQRALTAAEQLKFIKMDADRYITLPDCQELMKSDAHQRSVVFRKLLQQYKPFIIFSTFLIKGSSPADAARKTKIICQIPQNPTIIENSLVRWGRFADLFRREKRKLVVQSSMDKLDDRYILDFSKALQSELEAKLFISNKLSPGVFAYLQDEEIENLVSAIGTYERDPKIAIKKAGKAFEDFLRRICEEKYNCSTCAGTGQLLDKLIQKKEIDGRHLEIAKGINSIRIMAAHGLQRSL